jgi:hypothetical protein
MRSPLVVVSYQKVDKSKKIQKYVKEAHATCHNTYLVVAARKVRNGAQTRISLHKMQTLGKEQRA